MFARKLLLLVASLASALCSDNTSICKMVPDFGGIGNTTASPLPKDAGFCTNLNSTCCSASDFAKMNTVWIGDNKDKSLRLERSKEMKQVVGLVSYLMVANKDLLYLSDEIKKAKIDADPACSTPAYIHRKMAELELIKTAVVTFNSTAKRCWNYTKNLMNGLMCAACDHKAQDFIDYKKKELTLSMKECNTFLANCGDHLKAISAVYFYYNTYERLTYCNELGKFAKQKIPDFTIFPKNLKTAIDNCLNSNSHDDCVTVCQNQIGFTTMANYEYSNKQILASDKEAIEKYLEKKNEAKPQSKRVLQGSTVSPDVAETLKRLNAYTIRISGQGLDLYQYTDKNADKYEDIDIKYVFSARVATIAFLWAFLITLL